MKQEGIAFQKDLDNKDQPYAEISCEGPEVGSMASSAALGALLEAGAPGADAETRVRRLGEQLARLDAQNVAGMLAAASEGGGAGARLADRLDAGLAAGAALAARLRRCEAVARAAPDAAHARCGAARSDASARALLAELEDIYAWLDAPPLQDLDSLSEVSLATAEGRERALAAGCALRRALRGPRGAGEAGAGAAGAGAGEAGAGAGAGEAGAGAAAARRRLGAVRERLRRLARARDALAAALTRHLNNALIHLGNEAASERRRHHPDLLPYAPFMRWLKDMDERAFDGLAKVYTSTWARVYEREVHAALEAARAELAAAPPARIDPVLDNVLTLIESLCDAEQDFCTQFFYLDIDVKSDGSDGERSEGGSGAEGAGGAGGARAGAETRRFMAELFPALESELVALVAHVERLDKYGAMRALACLGRRVVGAGGAGGGGGGGGGAGEARWARAALAGGAVAAKRQADRAVAARLAALPDAAKQAARRPKCGLLPFLRDFEELSGACEAIFGGGRRADLDRWYVALVGGMLQAVQLAEHARTPRAVLHVENYHRLHALVAQLRVPALDALRRECRARYSDALRAYVTQYFGRPLEKLTQFFEGVSEAVAGGVREEEVCYRAAFSKHELRRLLAMYPAHEVRKSLHRLYRMVEKHLSEEGGLLQVVWRAMQEEFISQHRALQSRIATCYPGAGLAMPLTTQDILDAFSDIAREH